MRLANLTLSVFLSAGPILGSDISIPNEIEAFLHDPNNVVSEDGHLPLSPGVGLEFVRYTLRHWQAILPKIGEIAPDSRRQALLIVAAEFLPPREYVEFVSKVCDLSLQGRIDPQAINYIFWARLAKSGFLIYNYDKPEVDLILQKLQRIATKNPSIIDADTNYFQDLKSGRLKESTVQYRTLQGGDTPESFDSSNSSYYWKLMGGNLKVDAAMLAKNPRLAITSLGSAYRTKWTIVIPLILIITLFLVVFAIVIRFILKKLRGNNAIIVDVNSVRQNQGPPSADQ
jgi:hypothetical protein